MIQTNNFKENTWEVLLKIEKLPLIECYSKFMNELIECREYVN